jgi:hypothetical protein
MQAAHRGRRQRREIVDGTPGPRQQMELTDPDGYTVMVAQIEDE